MRYKQIGKTNEKIAELTVGTWAMGGVGWGDVDRRDNIAAIHAMLDEGVNFIDTALIYGNGVSEEVVGEAVRGKRDKVLLSTKGGLLQVDHHVVKDCSKESMLTQCDSSLKRLGTDYVDFYFVHWPDFNTPFAETMSAMAELKKAGKIRFVGVSNFTIEQMAEAEKYVQIDVFQPPYSMVNRTQERLIRWVHDHQIGIMTYGSLGGGILTGAFRTLPKFDAGDTRLFFYDSFVEPKFSKVMKLLETLDGIAAAHKSSVSQVAINWNTQKPFVDTSIIGVRNVKEAQENCAGLDWSLGEAEMAEIDAAILKMEG